MIGKFLFPVLLTLWVGLLIYLSGVPHLFIGTNDWLIRKLGHTAAYGILTYLLWENSSYVTKKVHFKIILCICIVLIIAVYDEIHQMSIPGRSGNYKGLLFDVLGMTLVLSFLNIVQRRTK